MTLAAAFIALFAHAEMPSAPTAKLKFNQMATSAWLIKKSPGFVLLRGERLGCEDDWTKHFKTLKDCESAMSVEPPVPGRYYFCLDATKGLSLHHCKRFKDMSTTQRDCAEKQKRAMESALYKSKQGATISEFISDRVLINIVDQRGADGLKDFPYLAHSNLFVDRRLVVLPQMTDKKVCEIFPEDELLSFFEELGKFIETNAVLDLHRKLSKAEASNDEKKAEEYRKELLKKSQIFGRGRGLPAVVAPAPVTSLKAISPPGVSGTKVGP